jgi:hypothetical protein
MDKSIMKIIFSLIFIIQTLVLGVVMQEGEFVKEQMELEKLKKELDIFYKQKDNQYKKQLEELQSLDNQIKANLQKIEETKIANQKILEEIDLKIQSKAMKLYGKMKVKLVYSILQEKIDNGNLNDVFDIIIRLKEKRVMKLMKLFDTQTATELMNMMSEHKQNQEEK